MASNEHVLDKSSSRGCNENWMGELPESLCCDSLKNIAIPGSHNSFSFFLDCTSPVSAGSPDTVRNLVSMFGNTAKQIVYNWSVTQSLSFREQLNLGIRYFDFRVAYWQQKEGFYFVHGLHGAEVSNTLNEIHQWLEEHPKEVLLIDFNHLYDMDGKHERLISCIEEIFASMLCPVMDMEAVTLNVMRDAGWQVIAFFHHPTVNSHPNIWPTNAICNIWPNTTEPVKMVNILNAHHTRGRPSNKFYISQGILTPTGTTVLQHITKSIKEVLAPAAIRNTNFFLEDKGKGPKGINIVIADFVELEGFVDAVLALNKK